MSCCQHVTCHQCVWRPVRRRAQEETQATCHTLTNCITPFLNPTFLRDLAWWAHTMQSSYARATASASHTQGTRTPSTPDSHEARPLSVQRCSIRQGSVKQQHKAVNSCNGQHHRIGSTANRVPFIVLGTPAGPRASFSNAGLPQHLREAAAARHCPALPGECICFVALCLCALPLLCWPGIVTARPALPCVCGPLHGARQFVRFLPVDTQKC